jgi:hypothetical protein
VIETVEIGFLQLMDMVLDGFIYVGNVLQASEALHFSQWMQFAKETIHSLALHIASISLPSMCIFLYMGLLASSRGEVTVIIFLFLFIC